MALVQTEKGYIDSSELSVKDVIAMEDNVRTIATEWYFGSELVRRDLNINILCGQSLSGEQQEI